VQGDVHRDEVVGILLVKFVGVPVADLDPLAQVSIGDGLPGQC
jgi:hypothetical protein